MGIFSFDEQSSAYDLETIRHLEREIYRLELQLQRREAGNMEIFNNLLMLTDSYKVTHWRQYQPGTQNVYSYLESRDGARWRKTVFFGLQYFLMKYLRGRVITVSDIDEADYYTKLHFGAPLLNRDGWEYIALNHSGRLPVHIKAVEEGTPVPVSNVMMTVEVTDPKCAWLTNYLETLLTNVWYPCTVATQSREMKKVWLRYLNETGTPESVDFKLHDFGCRGVTCPEQAGLGGAAHLVNFKGTDTMPALMLASKIYECDCAGYSIPASEHSTITSWGKDREVDAFRNMLTAYPEVPLVACVSDSYDIWKACSELWGGVLKEEVMSREGALIVRPDSGDPPATVRKVTQLLMDAFGYETNDKGYDVLPPQVRVIQGDGIDFNMIPKILGTLQEAGLSADNLAMGSGGGLLQNLNRDTQRFAFKCAETTVNGEAHDVFKDPVTDAGKKSKRGRLKLVWAENSHGKWLHTVPATDMRDDQLRTVFKDGSVVDPVDFDTVRTNASIHPGEL
jgi:nicotinamide phosphoribosyltransferase